MVRPNYLVPLVGLLLGGNLRAQEVLPPIDRTYAGIGVYAVENDLSGRWDSGAIRGTEFDVGRDLGFGGNESAAVWTLGASLGSSRSHKFDLAGYRYSDEGQRTLIRNMVIDGELYPIGGNFNGSLDVGVISGSYTWMFHQTERQATGLGLGLVRYDFDANLAVSTVLGGATVARVNALGSKAVAPLLSAEYVRTLGDKWRVGALVSYVKANRDGVDGEALDANVRVEWFPWKQFGFGLRYNYNEIDLDFGRQSFQGNLDVKNRGFQFFGMVRH